MIEEERRRWDEYLGGRRGEIFGEGVGIEYLRARNRGDRIEINIIRREEYLRIDEKLKRYL